MIEEGLLKATIIAGICISCLLHYLRFQRLNEEDNKKKEIINETNKL